MWMITLRDLQFRKRQFGIAIVGAGLVFALTLVLTGMSAGFYAETHATVNSIGTTYWIVPAGASGPFAGASVVDPRAAEEIQSAGPVHPLVIAGSTVRKANSSSTRGVNVIGHQLGGL